MMCKATILASIVVLLACSFARGSGYTVTLDLSNGKDHHAARSQPNSRPSPASHRESFSGSAGSQCTLNWKVVRTAHDTATDVLVHCYVVRLDRPGQAPPPLAPKRVVIESALTMDFPAGESANASLPFHVDGPGVFLVRVEAGGDPDTNTAGDYAELELVAK